MNKLIFRLGLCCSTCLAATAPNIDSKLMEDLQAIVKSSEVIVENAKKSKNGFSSKDEARFFKESLSTKSEDCNSQACLGLAGESYGSSGLVVLISTSVSESSWRAHSHILEKLGGRFVMRGLPGNSFLKFVQLVKGLKERGIAAPIELDPDLFKKYDVQSAPVIVLDDGEHFDKVDGNITIIAALELFSRTGATSTLAKTLSFDLLQANASGVLYEN